MIVVGWAERHVLEAWQGEVLPLANRRFLWKAFTGDNEDAQGFYLLMQACPLERLEDILTPMLAGRFKEFQNRGSRCGRYKTYLHGIRDLLIGNPR